MKVYIWGTGNSTLAILKNGIKCEVEGFIETKVEKEFFLGKKVISPDMLGTYDAIIIPSIYSDEICETVFEIGLEPKKLVFTNYSFRMSKYNNAELARRILSEKNYQLYVSAYKFYGDSFWADDKIVYNRSNCRESFKALDMNDYPILYDKYGNMGTVDQYFWQDLWAASLIRNNNPEEHFDIGSRLDGFLAHVLAMGIPLKVIDVRPFPVHIDGMQTIVDDATNLVQVADESISSLSALCSLEHFGLGRYGDPIDPEACFKCFSQIQNKVKSGGTIYISVPIGKEKVQFNAHRIFYADTIIKNFDKCELLQFSVCDDKNIEYDVDLHKYDNDNNRGEVFGLFYFKKK